MVKSTSLELAKVNEVSLLFVMGMEMVLLDDDDDDDGTGAVRTAVERANKAMVVCWRKCMV